MEPVAAVVGDGVLRAVVRVLEGPHDVAPGIDLARRRLLDVVAPADQRVAVGHPVGRPRERAEVAGGRVLEHHRRGPGGLVELVLHCAALRAGIGNAVAVVLVDAHRDECAVVEDHHAQGLARGARQGGGVLGARSAEGVSGEGEVAAPSPQPPDDVAHSDTGTRRTGDAEHRRQPAERGQQVAVVEHVHGVEVRVVVGAGDPLGGEVDVVLRAPGEDRLAGGVLLFDDGVDEPAAVLSRLVGHQDLVPAGQEEGLVEVGVHQPDRAVLTHGRELVVELEDPLVGRLAALDVGADGVAPVGLLLEVVHAAVVALDETRDGVAVEHGTEPVRVPREVVERDHRLAGLHGPGGGRGQRREADRQVDEGVHGGAAAVLEDHGHLVARTEPGQRDLVGRRTSVDQHASTGVGGGRPDREGPAGGGGGAHAVAGRGLAERRVRRDPRPCDGDLVDRRVGSDGGSGRDRHLSQGSEQDDDSGCGDAVRVRHPRRVCARRP